MSEPDPFEHVTTEAFWSIDDVSLNTFAWNITTLGDSRQAPPPLRGEDILVPYRVGRVATARVPDSRVITLGMWVIGATESGGPPTNESVRRRFELNWRKLRALLWRTNEFTLTKRFRDEAGNLVTASARARFAGGLDLGMNGPARGVFTVDLLLADPFFYGAEETVSLSGGDNTVVGKGDYQTTNITITTSGGGNMILQNMSLSPVLKLEVQGNQLIDVYNGVSQLTSYSLSPHTLKPNLQYGSWFLVMPGTQTIRRNGTASVTFKYRPAYL